MNMWKMKDLYIDIHNKIYLQEWQIKYLKKIFWKKFKKNVEKNIEKNFKINKKKPLKSA